MARVFVLSPANCADLRARRLLAPGAASELARRLREPPGAPLGEVFAFLSGLYFRGKLAYARTFAAPPPAVAASGGVLVIAPGAGLRPAESLLTLEALRGFARTAVDPARPRDRRPLAADAAALAAVLGPDCDVVLLGSIATDKYVGVLAEVFGPRLKFPLAFVGRGDMSRGGLLLRCVAEGRELEYVGLDAGPRRGPRPPRLPPLGLRAPAPRP